MCILEFRTISELIHYISIFFFFPCVLTSYFFLEILILFLYFFLCKLLLSKLYFSIYFYVMLLVYSFICFGFPFLIVCHILSLISFVTLFTLFPLFFISGFVFSLQNKPLESRGCFVCKQITHVFKASSFKTGTMQITSIPRLYFKIIRIDTLICISIKIHWLQTIRDQ